VIYLEVTWRTAAAFAGLLVMMRLSGKQQVKHLNVFEYIVGITIGSTASFLSVGVNEAFLPTFLGFILWVLFAIALNNITFRNRRWGKILKGEPTILIQNGRLMEKAMRQVPNFTIDDLLMMLRNQGVFDLSQVEFAVLELDGTVSVVRKSQHRPVTPHDLSLPTAYEGLPVELIYDGQIIEKNLKGAGLDHAWVAKQLKTRNIEGLDRVMLAQLNTDGTLFVDVRDDQPVKIDISDYRNQLEKM
jgi:uncharacterized membrane protein YcaP (DUF421 family)